jgi:hypothetical protein
MVTWPEPLEPMDLVPLPPLPPIPPIEPPNPTTEAEAFALWSAKWDIYKWALRQHTQRETVLAAMAIGTAIGEGVASFLEDQERVRLQAQAFELMKATPRRNADTDLNYQRLIETELRIGCAAASTVYGEQN